MKFIINEVADFIYNINEVADFIYNINEVADFIYKEFQKRNSSILFSMVKDKIIGESF